VDNNLIIQAIITGPLLLSIFCFLWPRLAKWLALLVAMASLAGAALVFFRAATLASGLLLAGAFFTLLVTVYSFDYMKERGRQGEYYGYLLLTLGAFSSVVFAADFLMLLFAWGIMGVALYLLVGLGGPKASSAATKTLLLVGGSDALMIIGIGLVVVLTRSFQIGSVPLPTDDPLAIMAFICLAAGAFAKAGVMPLHGWIPDSAEVAPLPVMAYLPAALDKLAGIYLLFRLCTDVFSISLNSLLSNSLLAIGSFTIVAAVFAAMIQHDLKKLLSFHAVSQVGYMVVGIGTGMPLGIAGGLFHMFNHTLYKSCLFFSAGAVESKTGETDLDKLGGLARSMPWTFLATAMAALAISGVPPFNGFFSKWLIYQGLIELAPLNPYWIIFLLAAMFGSALTLASFVKVIHAVFLGQGDKTTVSVKEVSFLMLWPMLTLAGLCLLFGLVPLPLNSFIYSLTGKVDFVGGWQPLVAIIFILASLVIGWLLYLVGQVAKSQIKPVFIGGELISDEETKVSGINFYAEVRRWGWLETIFGWGEKRYFDLSNWAGQLTGLLADKLSRLQNGLLRSYLFWLAGGVVIIFFVLMK